MDKRRNGGRKGFGDWETVPASVGDIERVAKLNVNLIIQHFI